jgi:hypothetical protein
MASGTLTECGYKHAATNAQHSKCQPSEFRITKDSDCRDAENPSYQYCGWPGRAEIDRNVLEEFHVQESVRDCSAPL